LPGRAPDFDYAQVEAGDQYKTCVKSVDLTRNGRAVPVIDEFATAAPAIWAEDHGYATLESNPPGC
jgi:hypothetical protein